MKYISTIHTARNFVILDYNCSIQEFTLTDDTVLEEHYEDPRLTQMQLLGDGGNLIMHFMHFTK